MSREALQESLSAVMDNEADELELRRVIAALENPETRATWSRYQVARAVMHKDLLDPHLDLSAAVCAAIAADAAPAQKGRSPWQSLGRLAVAASVTVAVLAGVRLYNQDDVAGAQLAQQQPMQPASSMPVVKGPAVLANYTEASDRSTESVPNGALQGQADPHAPGYLRQPVQQSAGSVGDSSVQSR
jgi:sigma-E factor negative regulatory protein RseA